MAVEHLKRRRQGEEREQYKWVVLTRPGTLYHPPTPHALRDGCTRTIAPARARAAEPLALERTLSDLVNLTCGLAWIYHDCVEQRSGESVRRLDITQPNENATRRFFCDRL